MSTPVKLFQDQATIDLILSRLDKQDETMGKMGDLLERLVRVEEINRTGVDNLKRTQRDIAKLEDRVREIERDIAKSAWVPSLAWTALGAVATWVVSRVLPMR